MLLTTGELGRARFALTDRWGGTSSGPYAELNLGAHVGDDPTTVQANRAALLSGLRGARELAFMSQVHGCAVEVVPANCAPLVPPEADALVTEQRGVALVALTADCVPVMLAGEQAPMVGAVHAGRRGVAAGVVSAAVEAMGRAGSRPESLAALVGPAVCGRCYEVPEDLQQSIVANWPEAFARTPQGTAALDLPAAVEAQLSRAGVGSVNRLATCTMESPDLFSHRRDGVTGRIAGVVWLPDDD